MAETFKELAQKKYPKEPLTDEETCERGRPEWHEFCREHLGKIACCGDEKCVVMTTILDNEYKKAFDSGRMIQKTLDDLDRDN